MTDVLNAPLAPKPDHVPAELVYDFDYYNVPGADVDVQAAYRAVQDTAPEIFWTPRNGGHWVATRAEDILVMQKDHHRFSHRHISIPPIPAPAPRQIPLEVDPPHHAFYRRPLMQALLPSAVAKLEQGVSDVAVEAIERLVPRGSCEFVEDFAKVLPIHVFLRMVDLPIADKDFLLAIAEGAVRGRTPETRLKSTMEMAAYLEQWVTKRRAEPQGDLLTQLVNVDIRGERISFEEAMSYAVLVLFGGLDTVAGMLAFFARFLATHDDHRRQIVARLDDDAFLNRVIEEIIRRHGIANTGRVITHDFEYKGVSFKAGEQILPPNLLVGVDDRLNPNPLEVDFERKGGVHAAFGNGAHACPGAVLARRELRIFLREWLSRIPDFRIRPGTAPVFAGGAVNGVLNLELVWS